MQVITVTGNILIQEILDYCNIVNTLDVDMVELGYRNPPDDIYKGSLYYCPTIILKSSVVF